MNSKPVLETKSLDPNTPAINTMASNTRSAGHMWPARAFCASLDALWEFQI